MLQHRRGWWAALVAAGVMALTGCRGGASGDHCEENSDCRAGLYCESSTSTCTPLGLGADATTGNDAAADGSRPDGGDMDAGSGCGNGVCDPNETVGSCPDDCCPVTACGDGTCTDGCAENCSTCPADCGPCGACGDGMCQSSAGEFCGNCWFDCGACPPTCGDDKCEAFAGETCMSCSSDCGGCQSNCGVLCGTFEDCVTCPACGPCPVCGDGICSIGDVETCAVCPVDCGVCPACTPDGVCDSAAGENCLNCTDCQPCDECGDGFCNGFLSGAESCDKCPKDCCP